MAELIRMPKMSDTMTEGVVAKWHKKPGEKIETGEILADIETDKATMEFESYQEGVLLYIGVPEGKAAPVNGILAIIGKAGEDYKALLAEEEKKTAAAPPPKAASQTKPAVAHETMDVTPAAPVLPAISATPPSAMRPAASADDRRSKVSPLARKLAEQKGIDITRVRGTGDGGRVVKRDIDWYKPFMGVSPVASVTRESYDEVPVSQMRKTIARRLADSKFTAPHFYLTVSVNAGQLIAAREGINRIAPAKISFNDLIVKATASSLRRHPKVNASWMGESIRYNHHVHIGVAVAVEEGLLVPVVRFADSKTLTQIASEVKQLSQKAKEKKLQPAEWEGSTFTISNLGMYGIDEFTAIINPPDACILAVGGIQEAPVVQNNSVVPGHLLRLTLSCDHRVVDGATGAAFLNSLTFYLENPAVLLGEGAI